MAGSTMYTLSRKLFLIRDHLKVWCLDGKLFWGINKNTIMNQLQDMGSSIPSLPQGAELGSRRRSLLNNATLAYSY